MTDTPKTIPPKHTAHGNYRRADHFEAACARLTAKLAELEALLRTAADRLGPTDYLKDEITAALDRSGEVSRHDT